MFYVILLLSIASSFYYIFAIYSTSRFFSLPSQSKTDFHPPISILKPVCGMESMAYENFASFCQQDYPEYQIIFGVRDADDPIVSVVNKIIADFPQKDIQLVICETSLGINPKISNLITMQKAAKYSFSLISDSDIRVGPTYLSETIQFMQDEQVGIVTCPYRSLAKTWRAKIGAVNDATEYMPGVFCAKQLDQIKWTLGCSVLIRETALNAIGGIQRVADYVAEDLLLGKHVTHIGYKIVLANYIVDHVIEHHSLRGIIRGKIRRDRGILTYNPWSYFSLLFTYGAALSMLLLLINHTSTIGVIVFGFVWITKLVMSWIISVKYLKDPSAKKWFWLSPLNDCISFMLWLYVFSASTIYWRGSYFKIGKDGRLVVCT
ncbi:bacteriohopanetetrol glucosamine biosynthesis glycosyltransferase HpnI [Legionella fallonii]|uniref:Ceramide glucosyltransferase n=1 Tax=Legionella fallonii LLAP-10 TaxID=1212491 RepID=A0A098G923_9GAMM|nr:bacteriohopanetetrol glucosamine biosynthesis glycosyltransferase HpnI [Legionella fallonii]CEG58999.1 Ceramide glucosyltransferase [Legionella fallonii LLAP-10]